MTHDEAPRDVASYRAALDGALHVRRARRRRILDEVEAHLADHADALEERGASPESAEAAAIAAFGAAAAVAESFSAVDRLLSLRRRTLAVTLLLACVSVAMGWNTYRAADAFLHADDHVPEMVVLLDSGASSDQVRALAAQVERLDGTAVADYESPAEAYRKASELLADQPGLRRDIQSADLPAQLRVDLDDPARFESVASDLRGDARVQEIVDNRRTDSVLSAITQGALSVAFILTALYLLATLVVAAQTRKVFRYGA